MNKRLQEFVANFPWVQNDHIPWAEMKKPLKKSKLALISTGGIYVKGDQPFAIKTREDVDESFRKIPREAPLGQLEIAHEHYNKRYAQEDINTVFPISRLEKLLAEGFIGDIAQVNYSITGYIPEPKGLYISGKTIALDLKEMEVDSVLLVPV